MEHGRRKAVDFTMSIAKMVSQHTEHLRYSYATSINQPPRSTMCCSRHYAGYSWPSIYPSNAVTAIQNQTNLSVLRSACTMHDSTPCPPKLAPESLHDAASNQSSVVGTDSRRLRTRPTSTAPTTPTSSPARRASIPSATPCSSTVPGTASGCSTTTTTASSRSL